MAKCSQDKLYVLGVSEKRLSQDLLQITFQTTRGQFDALFHTRKGINRAVIMLGGANGGFDGPGALYPKLAEELLNCGIASLRLNNRAPGDCVQCAVDTLVAVQYLDDESIHDIVLAGWSFGSAVAISSGSVARSVRGVVAMSPLNVAGCCARRLRRKPILVIHGEEDTVSPVTVADRLYSEADEPRQLIVYPCTGHTLEEAGSKLVTDIKDWALSTLNITCNKHTESNPLGIASQQ